MISSTLCPAVHILGSKLPNILLPEWAKSPGHESAVDIKSAKQEGKRIRAFFAATKSFFYSLLQVTESAGCHCLCPFFYQSICRLFLGSGPEGDDVLKNTGGISIRPSERPNERTNVRPVP